MAFQQISVYTLKIGELVENQSEQGEIYKETINTLFKNV